MQFEAAGFDLLAYGNPSKLPLGLVLPADAALRQPVEASLTRSHQAGHPRRQGAEASRHQEHHAHTYQVGDGADNQQRQYRRQV